MIRGIGAARRLVHGAVLLIIRRSWVRAHPVSEVDRRDAAYLAQLTTRSAARSG
jgi:hypothetical protein